MATPDWEHDMNPCEPHIVELPDGWYVRAGWSQAGPTTKALAEQILATVESAMRKFDGEKPHA